MKKISYYMLFLISIFIFSNSVYAKSVAKVCNYNNNDEAMAVKGSATITIYDDGSADAVMKFASSSRENKENIQNWSSIKSTYQSKKECPPYVNIYEDGVFSNAKVWAYYDRSQADSDAGKYKAVVLTGSNSGKNAPDKDKTLKRISEITDFCNSVANKNYNLNECKNNEKTATKYEECRSQAVSARKLIGSYISEVNGYLSKGYVTQSDIAYTTFKSKCSAAQDNVKNYEQAIDFISCREYNKDMNTDNPCSVKPRDVENNPYVKEYYNPTPEKPEVDTNGEDFFKICDASVNPQLVATFKLVGIFITIVKIVVPIILIIMGSLDMSKAVVSKDNDAIRSSLMVFLKRTFAGVLIFLAPSVILGIFHLVQGMSHYDSGYQTCVDCILGSSDCPNVSFIQGG